MTLFEIADVLWQHGENEAYNALVEHAREYTTIVECGLTLLAKDIAERAVRHELLTALEADLQLIDDRWAEAYMRAAELVSPNAHEFEATEERIYEQLCEQNWRP